MTMKAQDVTDTLDLTQDVSGCDNATIAARPRLQSGTGSFYVAGDLAKYLDGKHMDPMRGASFTHRSKAKLNAGIRS